MTAFDDLVHPLLTDPPRPAPSIDALRDRVAQRRHRRTGLAAGVSIVVLVIVGTVVALPRDHGTDVLAGPPGTSVGSTVPAPTVPSPAGPPISWPTAPSDDAPPIEPSSATFTFTPERAPLGEDRTLVIHSATGTYTSCGSMDLLRWDGSTWHVIATSQFVANEDADRPTSTLHVGPIARRDPCGVMVPLDTDLRVHVPDPALTPGWYQLYDGTARGRFAIATPDAGPGGAPPVSDLAGPPTTAPPDFSTTSPPTAVVTTGELVDLHPSVAANPPSGPASVERLPEQAIAIDDDTVALSWAAVCAGPAHHAEVSATTTEVVVRLSTVPTLKGLCIESPPRFLVTFNLPFPVHGRRLIFRADSSPIDLEISPKPAGSQVVGDVTSTYPSGDEAAAAQAGVTTMLIDTRDDSPAAGHVVVRALTCSTTARWDVYRIDGFLVPQLALTEQPIERDCVPVTMAPDPTDPKVFPGLIPSDS